MTTAQTQDQALRLDQAMQQADRAEEMAIKYGCGTSLGLEAYASAQTIRALHARVAELETQAQPARAPLEPMHPPGLTSVNAILSFNHGWRACQLAHGITGGSDGGS